MTSDLRNPTMRLLLTALITGVICTPGDAQTTTYRATMIRAAPGSLLELIDLVKARQAVYPLAGEAVPLLLRHAQGDQWDLLALEPIGELSKFFDRDRAGRWQSAARRAGFDEAMFADRQDQWIAWREELFVTGPDPGELHAAAAPAGYFHLEIFQALAGKRDSLLQEREMENDFLGRIGRPRNFVFRRVGGAAWDLFTLGLYRDLQHYAEPSGQSAEAENAAAVAAGFQSRGHIGAHLRRFLASHHDTLGTLVR